MAQNYYTYGTNLQNREFFTSTVSTNNGIKRYFSNVESEIYFGNKLIDDMYKFDFMVEEKKLPLYGYNCFYSEIIVPGQRIVQGSFVLNFTNGSYMRQVLSEIDDSIMCNKIIECETYNPSSEIRDKAIWSKNFDIMIGYGYYKDELETYNATCQTICCAQITNMQSVVDVTGEPIMEVYSFVAKDFIDGDYGLDNSSNNNNENNNTGDTGQTYIYVDRNNKEEYTKKYSEYMNNENATALVHDIIFSDKDNQRTLSVIITDFNYNPLDCNDVTLTISEQLNYNFITYKLDNKNGNTFIYDFSKAPYDGNILYESFTDDFDKIACSIKYNVRINSQVINIKYDGYIYPYNI